MRKSTGNDFDDDNKKIGNMEKHIHLCLRQQKRRQLLVSSLSMPLLSFVPVWAKESATASGTQTLWTPPQLASLDYDMIGRWKTDVSGTAHLDWKYNAANSIYSLDLSISTLLMNLSYFSLGFFDPRKGMLPTLFREKRTRRQDRTIQIDQKNNKISYSWKPQIDDKPQGVQDVTSIMLQFGFLLNAHPKKIKKGQRLRFHVARMGAVKEWDFKIENQEQTQTKAGRYTTWHIKRLPDQDEQDTDLQVEFWLAPELHYMPQKIHFNMKNDAYLHVSLSKMHLL